MSDGGGGDAAGEATADDGGVSASGGLDGAGDESGSVDGEPGDSGGGIPGCEIVHESGSVVVIEVVNARDIDVRLEGPGCLPPLRLFRERAELAWAWDCGWPVCPTNPDEQGCIVCDCGPDYRLLGPGESTTFEWNGAAQDLIEPDAACNSCEQCWLSTLAGDGTYEAITEFREPCPHGEPWQCEDPPALEQVGISFDYPADTVVLTIE